VLWRKVAEPCLEQLYPVGLFVDVGDRDEAILDRLVHNGGSDLWRNLQAGIRHLVDPHLCEVDAKRGLFPHQLAGFFGRGRCVRGARVEAIREGETAARGKRPRQIGPTGVRLQHQGHLLGVIAPDAPGCGHAVVELRLERLLGRRQRPSVVPMQVDQTGNDRFAGGINNLRAQWHLGRRPGAGRVDPSVTDHNDGVGDRRATCAINQLSTNDRKARGRARFVRRCRVPTARDGDDSEKSDSENGDSTSGHKDTYHSAASYHLTGALHAGVGQALSADLRAHGAEVACSNGCRRSMTGAK
jgi:hypothetical protein